VWPAKLLVPLGFAMLLAQGVSELIKRIAIMRGLIDDPAPRSSSAHAPE
jgi:TRAP-type mannitol/chloroaromatic compound transport system permease small subunit